MEKLYEFNIADMDDRNKIYQRKVDCERIAKELRKNADKADSQGNADLAQQMRERADELDKLASSYNGKPPEPGTAKGGNGGFGDVAGSGDDLLRKLVEQAKKRGPEACQAVRKVLSEIPESKISSSSKAETNTAVKNESLQEGIDLSRSLRD